MKLTVRMLKHMIKEEAVKIKKCLTESEKTVKDQVTKAKEVDADEFAETLEKKIDIIKALGLTETKLRRQLQTVSNRRKTLAKSLSK